MIRTFEPFYFFYTTHIFFLFAYTVLKKQRTPFYQSAHYFYGVFCQRTLIPFAKI